MVSYYKISGPQVTVYSRGEGDISGGEGDINHDLYL